MVYMSAVKLSVVIPVYNEAGNIATLVAEIHHHLHGQVSYEIIVIDDASCDDTAAEVQRLADTDPALRLLRHPRNYGQSVALRTGITAAIHDLIVTLDGDGQNDPAYIVMLLQRYQERDPRHKVVVFGERASRQDTVLKRLSSRGANRIRRWLLKDQATDSGCALKLFPKQAYLSLPLFNHCHRFLPALFNHYGYQVLNVPVKHRPRCHGQSKYGFHNRFWTGIVDLLGVYWLINRPCLAEVEEPSY